jgi:glycosyltransferase involved in cell wall biosynthesis
MLAGRKIVVLMPAYNASATLERTVAEVNREVVDDIILVDDGSLDGTPQLAEQLGIHTVLHPHNRGYGGNQKTCYRTALERGADVVVMVHPDYQYTPKLIRPWPAASPAASLISRLGAASLVGLLCRVACHSTSTSQIDC